MFSTVKKVADSKRAASGSHAELSVAIYKEKCVQEAFLKLMQARKEASESWLHYAENEESSTAKQLFLKMHTIEQFSNQAHQEYYNHYESYKGHFQQILKGERAVDDFRKSMLEYTPKINKVQKQIDALGPKGKDKKYENLVTEMGKYLSMQQTATKHYEDRKANHSLFKYKNIKDAVKRVTDAQIKLHEQCFEIFQTQRLLLDYFTATTYSSLSDVVIDQAKDNTQHLIDDLNRKLGYSIGAGSTQCASCSFEEASQEILDELQDVFGTPNVTSSSTPAESVAVYNAFQDEETKEELRPESPKSRPLPPLPPTAPECEYTIAYSTQTSVHSPQESHAPPIPPRRDMSRSASTKSAGGVASRENSVKSNSKSRLPDKVYLDMNQGSDKKPKQQEGRPASYVALVDSYSGPRSSSIKSNISSRSDSGRGSNSGHSVSSDYHGDEAVYEYIDGQRKQSYRTKEDDDVYEL